MAGTNKDLWVRAAELLGEAELSRRFRAWANGLIKKELAKRSNLKPDEFYLNQCKEIISHLNEVTGRRYTATPDVQAMIRSRMAAGYGVEDFQKVHKAMASRWLDDPKMRDYLRPSTLYRPAHFDEYLALYGAATAVTVKPVAIAAPVPSPAEQQRLVAKLLARQWWEFATWAEFMRWTMQFPDDKSLAQYEMPERIRKMRTAPGMVMKVLKGSGAEWAEKEYQEIKHGRTQV